MRIKSFLISLIYLLKELLDLAEEKILTPQERILKLIEKTAQKMEVSQKVYEEGLAVLKCESGLNPKALNSNKDGSINRGIAQWNSKYWPQITDNMAYDPEIALILFWYYFKQYPKFWTCYNTGAYEKFLERSQV